MRRLLITVHCLLITAFLSACTSTPTPEPLPTHYPSHLALYVFRPSPPALLKLSADLMTIERETPLSLPQDCSLGGLHPSPQRDRLIAEALCTNGPNSLLLDPVTGTLTPLISDSDVDSHFLSWGADDVSVYLRIDSLGDPRIVKVDLSRLPTPDSPITNYPITNYTYDLAVASNNATTFTFSRGFGFGSELWLTKDGGKTIELLLSDSQNYLSFARWSPDDNRLAFIKIPDTQIPFTVGELWVVNDDGLRPLKLAQADAGHGYAASWSPDGTRLAFVVRSNPDDPAADTAEGALISNIALVDLSNGALTQVTHFTQGRAETPVWSPDGNTLAFVYVLNGRMDVQIVDLASGEVMPLLTEPARCPIWLQG
jgi:dipeptidyl aminopeptidase/acylaminoacyl peptidase